VCGRIDGEVPAGVRTLSGRDGEWLDTDSMSAMIAHRLSGDA